MVWDVEWSIYLKFLLGCLWRPILYLKKTKWRTAHPEGVAYPTSTSMGPISAGRGRVISGRLANRCGSRFRTNTKLLPGVTGPISAPSDYLCTVFDDVILACAGAAETMSPPPPPPPPANVPMGKPSTCTGCCDSLPACVKSFPNMLFVGQIETYSLAMDS